MGYDLLASLMKEGFILRLATILLLFLFALVLLIVVLVVAIAVKTRTTTPLSAHALVVLPPAVPQSTPLLLLHRSPSS